MRSEEPKKGGKNEERVIGQWERKTETEKAGLFLFGVLGQVLLAMPKLVTLSENAGGMKPLLQISPTTHSLLCCFFFSFCFCSFSLYLPLFSSSSSCLPSSISTAPPRTMKRRRLAHPPSASNSGTPARVL